MLALRLHLLDESDTIAGLNFSSTTANALSEADAYRARVLATHCALLVTAIHEKQKATHLMTACRPTARSGWRRACSWPATS